MIVLYDGFHYKVEKLDKQTLMITRKDGKIMVGKDKNTISALLVHNLHLSIDYKSFDWNAPRNGFAIVRLQDEGEQSSEDSV